ncbi:MAG: Crp/Fnr family transcriptional regulator [Clostridia bacterium]|nr:Crp/Fnr family transcriptional regulator [Clostridia bacterium]
MGSDLELIRKIAIFSDLSDEELALIDNVIVTLNYKKRGTIFMEGQPGVGVYFVYSGQVKIFKVSEDGREQILHFRKAGDIFGEVVLFDGGAYPASAEALVDAQVGVIRNQDLENLLMKHPSMAVKLLKLMAKKLRRAQMKVHEITTQDTLRRVIRKLIRLARVYGEKTEQGVKINLELNRQDLASYVGTTRETVTRILSDLKKTGAIELDAKSITIIDLDKLKSWL